MRFSKSLKKNIDHSVVYIAYIKQILPEKLDTLKYLWVNWNYFSSPTFQRSGAFRLLMALVKANYQFNFSPLICLYMYNFSNRMKIYFVFV